MLPDNIEDAFALSPIQKGMLYDSLLHPDSDVYTAYVTIDIEGAVDTQLLQNAVSAVFHRHQALRAEFHWEGLDEPLQVIRKTIELDWKLCDWSDRTNWSSQEFKNEIIRQERTKNMAINSAPLFRFVLVKKPGNQSLLLWVVHHLVADGISTPVLLADIVNQAATGTDIKNTDAYQYSQYIEWLNRQDHQKALSFWQHYLDNARSTPIKLVRPFTAEIKKSDDLGISQVNAKLTVDETLDITDFCKKNRITLSTLLHGAWALVIREYSDTEKSLFVSTVSGRDPAIPGMSQAVGLYLNAMPRYIDTETVKSVVSWLSELQVDIHRSAEYEFTALGDIHPSIDRGDSGNYFDSILTVGGHDSELDISQKDFPFKFNNIHYQSTQSHYDLAFLAFPGKSLEFSLVYEPTRFSEHDIGQMAEYLIKLLKRLLVMSDESPATVCRSIQESRIEEKRNRNIPALSTQNLYNRFNDVHRWIESTVDQYPNKIAVRCGDSSLTFQELDKRANSVSRMLLDKVAGNYQLIGLMIPRSIEQIVGMMGILKAGFAYVPIDVSYPDERVTELITAASLSTMLVSETNVRMNKYSGVDLLPVENAVAYSTERMAEEDLFKNHPNDNITNIVPPGNTPLENDQVTDKRAYVMFTSGSTGRPKGVIITHKNLIYSTSARHNYYEETQPTFLLLSSISFDSCLLYTSPSPRDRG